jgi:hypothetical protein
MHSFRYKNGLGHILGDFFTNSSGHSASHARQTKVKQNRQTQTDTVGDEGESNFPQNWQRCLSGVNSSLATQLD